MMIVLCFVLALGLVSSATVPQDDEKADRSVILPSMPGSNCVAQWQTNNPCVNNPLNKLNFPLPGDNTKFIQCGSLARMFIIQCPQGEQYDQATTACVKIAAIIAPAAINNGFANPCTVQNLRAGRFFFSLPADSHKFIECDQVGNARIMTCPSGMLWGQSQQSCVFQIQAGTVMNPGTIGTGMGTPGVQMTMNPCTINAINTKQLFFSHPDPTKFIQCDLQGNAFVQNCPSGLVWNQYQETCASQLASLNMTG